MKKEIIQTSFRLSIEGIRLLKELSFKLGLTMTGVIELAIRSLAKKEKVTDD